MRNRIKQTSTRSASQGTAPVVVAPTALQPQLLSKGSGSMASKLVSLLGADADMQAPCAQTRSPSHSSSLAQVDGSTQAPSTQLAVALGQGTSSEQSAHMLLPLASVMQPALPHVEGPPKGTHAGLSPLHVLLCSRSPSTQDGLHREPDSVSVQSPGVASLQR